MIKLAISTVILIVSVSGCSVPDGGAQQNAWIRACGLQDDPFITGDVTLHACPPEAVNKTTICHIPPGNPSNAHTLCVSNAAVRAHMDNHLDLMVECVSEAPCDTGDAGVGDADGSGGGSDAGSGSDAGCETDAGSEDGGVIIL
jgi:hypothetical protein